MLDLTAATKPTDSAIADRVVRARKSVAEAATLVEVTTGTGLRGRILEIGCYDGAAAFALARDPQNEVVASDLARYYVVQRPETPTMREVEMQQGILAGLRAQVAEAAAIDATRVAFVEDDVTSSSLEPGSFDAIVSFEVLEHVSDPHAAFAAMARLLRPGGIAYHDYNPFFAANGGHSLCTLDFPWGHARLDHRDFERYLDEIRPAEAAQSLRFYRESLNRMTRRELASAIDAAGLETITLIPWTQRALTGQVTRDVMTEVRRTYPQATVDDLLGTFVSVVVRRS